LSGLDAGEAEADGPTDLVNLLGGLDQPTHLRGRGEGGVA
jgi:hypothetical protein